MMFCADWIRACPCGKDRTPLRTSAVTWLMKAFNCPIAASGWLLARFLAPFNLAVRELASPPLIAPSASRAPTAPIMASIWVEGRVTPLMVKLPVGSLNVKKVGNPKGSPASAAGVSPLTVNWEMPAPQSETRSTSTNELNDDPKLQPGADSMKLSPKPVGNSTPVKSVPPPGQRSRSS